MSPSEFAEKIVVTERVAPGVGMPPAPRTLTGKVAALFRRLVKAKDAGGWGIFVYQGPEDVDRHAGALPPMLVFRDEDRAVAEKVCATVRRLVAMGMQSTHEVQQGERKLVLRVLESRAGTRHQLAADLLRRALQEAWKMDRLPLIRGSA